LDEKVKYYSNTGSSPVGGLSNNGVYYVVQANTVSVKLSVEKRGTPIDLTAATGNTSGQYLERLLSDESYTLSKVEDIAGAGHHLYLRTPVSGLTPFDSYYVVNTNSKSVQLALTANGSAINITPNANAETGHYLTRIVEEQ
jgi:hypothetical protein